jgi:hypothetical protein
LNPTFNTNKNSLSRNASNGNNSAISKDENKE